MCSLQEPFSGVRAVEAHKTIGEITYIHNAYVEVRFNYYPINYAILQAKKRLGLTDFGQSVEKMNPVDEIKKTIEKHRKAFEESGQETAFEVPKLPESAGTSRANLKSRAYSAKMKHTRQRRHLDPNMEGGKIDSLSHVIGFIFQKISRISRSVKLLKSASKRVWQG